MHAALITILESVRQKAISAQIDGQFIDAESYGRGAIEALRLSGAITPLEAQGALTEITLCVQNRRTYAAAMRREMTRKSA